MQKMLMLCGLISLNILTVMGTSKAADLYDNYENDRFYKDNSYIDQTLDEFEKRNGIYKKDKYQYQDFSEQNHKYSYKDDHQLHRERKTYNHKHNHHYDDKYERDTHLSVHCIHPRKIKRRLVQYGWHDFKLLNKGPRRIRLLARNEEGVRYKMVLDRCMGSIIKLRALNRYSYRRNYY